VRKLSDFIYLEIANKYFKKIVTFDNDFKNLQKFYDVEIEILGDNQY
jgi:predicted nucleic acid-binding protein